MGSRGPCVSSQTGTHEMISPPCCCFLQTLLLLLSRVHCVPFSFSFSFTRVNSVVFCSGFTWSPKLKCPLWTKEASPCSLTVSPNAELSLLSRVWRERTHRKVWKVFSQTCFSVATVLTQARFCPQGGVWQCLETFLVVTLGCQGVLLTSGGSRPVMLPNVPQVTGLRRSENPSAPRLRKPAPQKGWVCCPGHTRLLGAGLPLQGCPTFWCLGHAGR